MMCVWALLVTVLVGSFLAMVASTMSAKGSSSVGLMHEMVLV